MHINPYGEGPVLLAVDLANDPAVDLDDLLRRCDAHDMLAEEVRPEDFDGCRALIDAWLTVVDAEDVGARVERLNTLLAEHASHPRLTDHAGSGWHIHYRESGATLTGQLAVRPARRPHPHRHGAAPDHPRHEPAGPMRVVGLRRRIRRRLPQRPATVLFAALRQPGGGTASPGELTVDIAPEVTLCCMINDGC